MKVTPSFCICRTCGMYCTRFQARSSVRMKTMFGRLAAPTDEGGGNRSAATAGGGLAGGAGLGLSAASLAFGCPKFGLAVLQAVITSASTCGNGLLAFDRWA